MNIFAFRDRLIADYAEYVKSFMRFDREDLRKFVEEALAAGALWPDALIQLNPSFEPGKSVDELVAEGILQKGAERIFRRDKSDENGDGQPLRLHKHQEEAIRIGVKGEHFVLTTGTGSGKSLAYIVPIVNHILKTGSGQGIKAIIIYPMNALANSQYGELEKFLKKGFGSGPFPASFERYTGQEDQETRDRIIQNPPDILLTNYVMLELILTRPGERRIIEAARQLQFLVLDELHTYRGRQGADVTLLLRRIQELLGGKPLTCVGTSATLAGPGTWQQQRKGVAELASRLFGGKVPEERIVGETLQRISRPIREDSPTDIAALKAAISQGDGRPFDTFERFREDSLARWLEGIVGVVPESESGRLVRSSPASLTGDSGLATRLSKLTGSPREACERAILGTLLKGATQVHHPETSFPVFPFRIHQFISRGDTLYATVEAPEERALTFHGQKYSPESRDKILLPLCFCRDCGQEYYSVWEVREEESGAARFVAREAFYVSPKGGFGQYVRRQGTFASGTDINLDATKRIICDLLAALKQAGIVKELVPPGDGAPVPGYQINAGSLIWKAGDGTSAYHDRIRMPSRAEKRSPVNPFFVQFYKKRIHERGEGIREVPHQGHHPRNLRRHVRGHPHRASLPNPPGPASG